MNLDWFLLTTVKFYHVIKTETDEMGNRKLINRKLVNPNIIQTGN